MLKGLQIDCTCGESLDVEGLPDELHDEDVFYAPVKCKCGERYQVRIGMDIIGKEEPGSAAEDLRLDDGFEEEHEDSPSLDDDPEYWKLREAARS